MRYQTSFHMHVVTYVKLARASQRTGKSMMHLIKQMMYNYAADHKKLYLELGTVKYQRCDKGDNWRLFRVSLKPDDYELFTDMRKVMKKSVSLLVALAVKKYLDTIISTIIQQTYHYISFRHKARCKKLGLKKRWIFDWIIKKRKFLKPIQATQYI